MATFHRSRVKLTLFLLTTESKRGKWGITVTATDFDAELIRALREDGRASIRSLATRLAQPRAAVAARLRVLLEDRTIRIIGAVDPFFLGQHVIAHVSIRTTGPAAPTAMALRALPETVFLSAVGGLFDLVTEVRLGSMDELHAVIERIRGLPLSLIHI